MLGSVAGVMGMVRHMAVGDDGKNWNFGGFGGISGAIFSDIVLRDRRRAGGLGTSSCCASTAGWCSLSCSGCPSPPPAPDPAT